MTKPKLPNTILIIGLGNPGEQYENSPHNAGFLALGIIANELGVELDENKKLKSEIAQYKNGKRKIILAKPQTFMNKSGEAVGLIKNYYKISFTTKSPPHNIWVIHDDVDLELGQIKIVKNRGSAGHKGVLDIIQKLKTQDFVRFRVGVRPKRLNTKRSKTVMNKFVASPIGKAEQIAFKKAIKHCAESVKFALDEGIEKTANTYNR
jgi:peptidyl-tRNA hydrolase, PTH1 family